MSAIGVRREPFKCFRWLVHRDEMVNGRPAVPGARKRKIFGE
jgi:hypothetical protein